MAKPHKVEEPAGTYSASPKKRSRPTGAVPKAPATSDVRRADGATFRKAADKVFATHGELFRKLAQ